jgi:hypothetical protein
MENNNSQLKKETFLKGIDKGKEISEEYCEFIPEENDKIDNKEYKMNIQGKKNAKLAGITGNKQLIDEAKHVGDKNV